MKTLLTIAAVALMMTSCEKTDTSTSGSGTSKPLYCARCYSNSSELKFDQTVCAYEADIDNFISSTKRTCSNYGYSCTCTKWKK